MIKYENGCWLRFMKIPPANNEADAGAAKKPPAKGAKGGAQTEDLKPVFGRAWVNLKELSVNGSIETKQRVYLETCAPIIKKSNAEGIEEEVEETNFDKVFEASRTYVHIRISLSEPVVPVPTKAEPTPAEVVPVK